VRCFSGCERAFECFHDPHAIRPTPDNIFGVLSLSFWALIIISIKYCIFVLRADNDGEGGSLALTALATSIKIVSRKESWVLVVLGIFGAAPLYCDGIMPPSPTLLHGLRSSNTFRASFHLKRIFATQPKNVFNQLSRLYLIVPRANSTLNESVFCGAETYLTAEPKFLSIGFCILYFTYSILLVYRVH
jgi:hypothetical protein